MERISKILKRQKTADGKVRFDDVPARAMVDMQLKRFASLWKSGNFEKSAELQGF